MGICHTANIHKTETITVASLNYSGILTSPYEYYQKQDEQEKKASQVFSYFVQQKYPEFGDSTGEKFTWDMGSIDTKWKNRYSPVNVVEVGIKEDNTMMNEKQFSQKWEEIHQKTRQAIKKNYFEAKYKPEDVQNRMKTQIQRCREFDLFCYKTFMKLYYDIDNISKDIGKVDATKYREIRQKLFSKPYLSQANKMTKTLNCIQSIQHDVIFFQETNKLLIQQLQKQASKYHVVKKSGVDSVILISKKLVGQQINFQKANKEFLVKYSTALKVHDKQNNSIEQIEKRLNFNQDSIFQAFGDYLLLNIHLSSKKQKNPDQMRQFITEFSRILEVIPEAHLICGGDFNGNISLDKFNEICKVQNPVNIAPSGKNTLSVKKKRTLIQPQRHKANKLDQATKDYLLSTMPIIRSEIMFINGKIIDKNQELPLTPCVEHPYDHFMILAELQKPKQRFETKQ